MICKNRRVTSIAVFGSIVTSSFSKDSDIDFVVNFSEIPLLDYADNYFGLQEDLEQLFGRSVDLVTATSLTNPYLIEEIEKTKQVVYAA